MYKRVSLFIILLIFAAFIACSPQKKDTSTYFGGKIINPKTNYVVLFEMEKVLDTFYLDNQNKFLGTIDTDHEGLYYYEHGSEHQYVYIKPQDSILLRLNTWDFDESLVYSGRGAERNNILMECFIETEKDNKAFYSFYKLSPDEFKQKTDSIEAVKLLKSRDFEIRNPNETSGFKKILKVALTYPIYSRIERYPIVNSRKNPTGEFPKTGNSFYDYRDKITVNQDSLMHYYTYSKYISNYVYNATYSLGYKPMNDEFSCEFTVDLLKTISDKINAEKTRNAFLKQTVIEHFYKKSSCEINEEAFNTFFKLSTDNKDKKTIQRLLNDSKLIEHGEKMVEFTLTDYNNIKHSSKDVLKHKNSFIFFWSSKYVSKSFISSRINYLSNKYKNVQFFPIKIDGNTADRITSLDIKNQFFIDSTSKANLFLTSKFPRSILVNHKGIVTNGYASISSNKIYNQIKELEKN
jgi:hypothetical protein